jgi:hypothetical protein
LALLLVLVLSAAVVSAGCGGSSKDSSLSPAAMRLERADLVFVSRGLRAGKRSIRREVATSRVAWPHVAGGLPESVSRSTRLRVSAASARARRVATPSFLARAGQLTGPAAEIAGLYQSFSSLSARGWRLTKATLKGISAGSPATVRFLRANAGLYISCVYDAHFDLSSIGENLRRAYRQLGGGPAFGRNLPPGEVEMIARAYSPRAALLQPHPRGG